MDRFTIRHANGLIEDVPLDVAHRLVSSGRATQLTPLPPVVETAMLADPPGREAGAARKPRTRKARGS